MKKFLKIAFFTLVALLIILILIPIFFKKPIMNKVKEEMNNSLNAKVEFTDFTLSLIRGFPNFYVALENLSVVGIEEFENDTLVSFKKFSAKIDLISAIKMENIKIKSVFLEKPSVFAHILPNGKVNWDIVKPSADSIPEDTTASEPLEFKASLKKFEIRDARIVYLDDSSKMKAALDNWDLLLSGDFTASTTDATLKTSIEKVNFYMDNIRYLRDTRFAFDAILGADMDKMLFTIKDNEIKLNDLSMGVEGSVAMPAEDIDMDLKFNTKKADFKSLLSLVPAVYMKDFESVQTSGSLKLDGFAKGTYSEKTMPNVGLTLVVDNAMFKYPDLPKSVDNINIDTKLYYDGVNDDNTTVDVNKFHMEMGGNPFDMTLHIKTPMSDMQLAGSFKGKIDFSSLTDVVPMDSITLKGLMESNIELEGRMSSIENEKYEEFKADGTLRLTNFEFTSTDFPQGIKIVETNMVFSPRFVELTSFNALMGKSDMNMTGRLSNFIPYVFNNDTIVGSLNFTSNLLDINEMMGSPTTPDEPVAEDTTALTVIEVPGNIDFTLNTRIGTIKYDNMDITNVLGTILVRNSKAVLNNLGMNMLEGSLVMNGEYNTQDVKSPLVDFNLNMKDFDIPATFTTFNTVQKLAPVAKSAKDQISAEMAINTRMDEHMNPIYSTMQGKGKLMSNSIEIGNSKMFEKVADALKNDKLRKFSMNDLNLSFEIKDGRVYIEPFETKLWSGKMIIGGDQGIDQTLNYAITFSIPRSEFGGAANAALTSLTSAAAAKGLNIQPGEMVNIDTKVVGTVSDPKVQLNLKESGKTALKDVKEQLKTAVTEKVETVKEDVKAKAREQADKLIKDAEAEAQKIRDIAKSGADQLRKESDAAADRLVKDVKNPIQKIAQQKLADKTRKEGYEKADKIEKEADAKAKALIDKARAEAEKL
jgi:hypothetical protein